MSYTTDDLTAIRQAIVDLGKGKRVVQVKSANGKTLTYQAADLPSLERIEASIKTELARAGSTKARSRTRHITTSKGL